MFGVEKIPNNALALKELGFFTNYTYPHGFRGVIHVWMLNPEPRIFTVSFSP